MPLEINDSIQKKRKSSIEGKRKCLESERYIYKRIVIREDEKGARYVACKNINLNDKELINKYKPYRHKILSTISKVEPERLTYYGVFDEGFDYCYAEIDKYLTITGIRIGRGEYNREKIKKELGKEK